MNQPKPQTGLVARLGHLAIVRKREIAHLRKTLASQQQLLRVYADGWQAASEEAERLGADNDALRNRLQAVELQLALIRNGGAGTERQTAA